MDNYNFKESEYSLLPKNYFDNKNRNQYRFLIAEDILKASDLQPKNMEDPEIIELYNNVEKVTIYAHIPWCVEHCTYCYYWGKVEGRSKMQLLIDAELKHLNLINDRIKL